MRVLLELDVLGSAIRKILTTVDEMEKTARKTDDPTMPFTEIILRLKANCLELLRVQQEKLADLDQGSLLWYVGSLGGDEKALAIVKQKTDICITTLLS